GLPLRTRRRTELQFLVRFAGNGSAEHGAARALVAGRACTRRCCTCHRLTGGGGDEVVPAGARAPHHVRHLPLVWGPILLQHELCYHRTRLVNAVLATA